MSRDLLQTPVGVAAGEQPQPQPSSATRVGI